jgi:hypothetical protein
MLARDLSTGAWAIGLNLPIEKLNPSLLLKKITIFTWRPDMKKLSMLATVVGAAVLAATPFSLRWSPERDVILSLDHADAEVGRPLTPGSVAGVHRRVERRSYRRGVGAAAAGAAAIGPAAPASEFYLEGCCVAYPQPQPHRRLWDNPFK